jgi:hypothetical protein
MECQNKGVSRQPRQRKSQELLLAPRRHGAKKGSENQSPYLGLSSLRLGVLARDILILFLHQL